MSIELTRLLNTLLTIETKGASTKSMAQCLTFLENLIIMEQNREQAEQSVNNKEE